MPFLFLAEQTEMAANEAKAEAQTVWTEARVLEATMKAIADGIERNKTSKLPVITICRFMNDPRKQLIPPGATIEDLQRAIQAEIDDA